MEMATSTPFDEFCVSFPPQVEQELGEAYGQDHWAKIKHALAKP